jgi:membrane associated rhomboid family serine protease
MRFIFAAIDRREGYLLREHPRAIQRVSLVQCLQDRRVVFASLIFLALNLLAMVGFGKFGASGAIAWEAHIGGYVFGLCAFALFDVAPQYDPPSSPDFD